MNELNQISYYTEDGLKKLKDELHKLKTVERTRVAQEIAEARAKGDLSENAEYDAAKEFQYHLEGKIKTLEILVGNARVMSQDEIDLSKVGLLSKVTVLNKKVNKIFEYNIVATHEADLKLGKISIDSPIAKAMLGKSVGDVAIAEVPAGNLELEILKIGV